MTLQTRSGFLCLHLRDSGFDRWVYHAAITELRPAAESPSAAHPNGTALVTLLGRDGRTELTVSESVDDILAAIDSCQWMLSRQRAKAFTFHTPGGVRTP